MFSENDTKKLLNELEYCLTDIKVSNKKEILIIEMTYTESATKFFLLSLEKFVTNYNKDIPPESNIDAWYNTVFIPNIKKAYVVNMQELTNVGRNYRL